MVIGIIAIAVGDELAIANPHDPNTVDTAVLIFGGPTLFLLAQLAFMRRPPAAFPVPASSPASPCWRWPISTAPLGLLAAVIAASGVLVAVAAADTREEEGLRLTPEAPQRAQS